MGRVDWKKIRREFETSDALLKDLAVKYGVKPGTVRSRKNREGWTRRTDNATQHNTETRNVVDNVATQENKPEPEPFPGQCEAIGNKTSKRCRRPAEKGDRFCYYHKDNRPGQCTATSKQTGKRCRKKAEPGKNVCKFHGGAPGSGAPKGSQNALRHGFYAKIFPDDEEIREIYETINTKNPLDILWEQTVIQYTTIARAQKLMYVRDQADIVRHLKKQKDGEAFTEREWEFQYPWDRHAAFLTAQSRAMATLERLITRYESMANDEEKLKLAKLKQDMEIDRERLQLEKSKVLGDPDETADDGFIDALHGKVGEAWNEHGDCEED